MRRKNYKGRCEKRMISKCKDVCRTYDAIQSAYADVLQACEEIIEIRVNVPLDGLPEGEYTSDFVCTTSSGTTMVRECFERKKLLKPMVIKLMDISRRYWAERGITDWGIVIDEQQ